MDTHSDSIYDIIHRRRDVRGQFTGAPIDRQALERVLDAAHAAPSVGLTQPWDFILIDDTDLRTRFHAHVEEERAAFAATLDLQQAAGFASIKVDGVLESSLSIVVTYDPLRGAPSVLGRNTIADTGLYSTCLAIQNLWPAATAEGLGVGWVSFCREPFLRSLLAIPDHIRPVAWLCIGPVTHLETTPDLERHNWRTRRPLHLALHHNRWSGDRTSRGWRRRGPGSTRRPKALGPLGIALLIDEGHCDLNCLRRRACTTR